MNGTTSGGDQSLGKMEAAAIGQPSRFLVQMKMLNGRPEQEVDSLVAIGIVRFVEDLISGLLAPEKFLGEWRTVVRKMILLAHERNRRLRIELPELFGGLIRREPTAD